MAIGTIGGIAVKITADIEGFQAGLNKVKKRLSTATSELRDSANEYGKWAAAGVAAATAISAAIYKSTASNIRELKIQAQVANTTTQELQKMAYAAKAFGIEEEKLSDILKDVNDRIGDFGATGAGPMVDFFENIAPKVGVTYENFKNLSGKDALQLYVTSLERANLSQADMTFYMEAIASNSTRLIPLLKNNGAAMAAMALEAEKLGVVLSDIDIAKVENANRELDKAALIVDSAMRNAVVSVSPLVAAIAENLNNAAIEAGGFGSVFDSVMSKAVSIIGVFADGLHGIRVVFEGLLVGVASFRAAWAEAMRIMTVGMEQFVNVGIAGLNRIISVANEFGAGLEPIQAFTFGAAQMFTDLANESSSVLSQAIQGWHELAMQPLPSEQLEQWVENVKAAAEKVQTAVSTAMGGSGGESGMSKEELKALDDRLAAIRENLMSEQQLKAEAYLADLEAIKQKRELDLENKAYYDQLEKDLQQKHYNELVAITQDAANKERAIEEAKTRSKLSMVSSMFGNLSSLMNTESRKMFEIGKTAAVSQAVVDGYAAVSKTMSATPYPWNIPLAAAQGAASLSQIKGIMSTSFGSAGTGQVYSGGQVATATTSASSAGASTPNRVLDIAGFSSNGNYSFTGQELISLLREAVGDGYTVQGIGG